MYNLPYDNTGVTVELRELIENGVDIWDFDYPTYYTGAEKAAFENKVTQHYWFRQIGQETPGRWLHYFRQRMREIMPYYIQLYKSQEIMDAIEDPFGNVDITETLTEERTGNTSETKRGTSSSTATDEATSSSEGKTTDTGTTKTDSGATSERSEERTTNGGNTRKFSNTPQGSIANLDNYLTEATVDSSNNSDTLTASDISEQNSTTTVNNSQISEQSATGKNTMTASGTNEETASGTESGTLTSTLHRKGNHGVNTYAHDMIEYRQTFLNIDMQIIDELKDLFLQVY